MTQSDEQPRRSHTTLPMTDDLPTPDEILAAHDRIEEIYDLKYPGTMTAAPNRTLRREVLEPAAEYDDPYHRAATLLWEIESTHVFEDANKRTACRDEELFTTERY